MPYSLGGLLGGKQRTEDARGLLWGKTFSKLILFLLEVLSPRWATFGEAAGFQGKVDLGTGAWSFDFS